MAPEWIAATRTRAERALTGLSADAVARGCRLTFESWIPQSARLTRRRLFVTAALDGRPWAVAKLPLWADDQGVAREQQTLTRMPALAVSRTRCLAGLDRGFVMNHLPARDFSDSLAAADVR